MSNQYGNWDETDVSEEILKGLDEEIDEMSLEQITKEIEFLCRKRTAMLSFLDVSEPYIVFDASKGVINQQTWVLDPDKELDFEVLQELSGNIPNKEQRENLQRWLKEYTENKCRRNRCDYVNSPVCCNYCECKDHCGFKHERCTGCDLKDE